MQSNGTRHLGWKKIKGNARLLVEALHSLADGDLDKLKDGEHLKQIVDTSWEGSWLWVKKTRLRDLAHLTEKCGKKLETEEIRNAIHCLKALEILEDKRGATNSKRITGSDKWYFVLKFPGREKQENLAWLFGKADKEGEWERRKPKKQVTAAPQIEEDIPAVNPAAVADNGGVKLKLDAENVAAVAPIEEDIAPVNPATAANNRGVKLKEEGDLVAARKQFELAIKLNPDNAAAYYNLAVMHEEARKFDRAFKLYQEAGFRGFAAAYCKLARLWLMQNKDSTETVEIYCQGLKLIEKEKVEDDKIVKAALLTYWAWDWKEQGRFEEALEKLQAAVELQKDRGLTYGIMAEVLETLGQDAAALEAWQNCLEYARSDRRDEDVWIGKARQRLNKV